MSGEPGDRQPQANDDQTIRRPPEADVPHVEGFIELTRIGRGGFSTVYAATELAFRRRVALKVLQGGADEARRVERESLALGALSGIPYVITPHSVVHTALGQPALVLPLFPWSLGSLIRGASLPAHAYVARWAGQVALALDAAHQRGIHHRDIKPENVLISETLDAHLADFGIASVDGLEASTITISSLSPQHAPPERFSDDESNPAAGDLYSFASTLYTALIGQPPFGTTAHGGLMGLMRRISDDPLPALPGVLAPLQPVFAQAMAKQPDERFPSAAAFVDALRRAGPFGPRSEMPTLEPPGPFEPHTRTSTPEADRTQVRARPDADRRHELDLPWLLSDLSDAARRLARHPRRPRAVLQLVDAASVLDTAADPEYFDTDRWRAIRAATGELHELLTTDRDVEDHEVTQAAAALWELLQGLV